MSQVENCFVLNEYCVMYCREYHFYISLVVNVLYFT